MSAPAYNSVAWFEVGTSDPDGAQQFYGQLFDWTFAAGDPEGAMDYREVTAPGADEPTGGIFNTGGQLPNYAIFYVLVQDVAATLSRAEQLGGKVLVPATTTPNGLVFGQLHDPAGNHFGIFTPAPSS